MASDGELTVMIDVERLDHELRWRKRSREWLSAEMGWNPKSIHNLLARARSQPIKVTTVAGIAWRLNIEPRLLTIDKKDPFHERDLATPGRPGTDQGFQA